MADVDAFVGVMGVDPGGKTGCSLGVYPADAGWTVRERVEYAIERGWHATFEVVLDSDDERAAELMAAEVIAREWVAFAFTCMVPSGAEWVNAPSVETVSSAGSSADTWLPCEPVMVIEEWTPRLPLASAERDAMYPIRIASCLEGLLYGRVTPSRSSGPVAAGAADASVAAGAAGAGTALLAAQGHRLVYQQPAQAKRFASDKRLKSWGLWVRGSDHERDANRHVCTFLAGLG